jgi:hypothetical protein
MNGHPLMQSIAAIAAERGVKDPATLAMTMGLLAIGTFTCGPLPYGVIGREPDDSRLLESTAVMFAACFPQPTD